MVRSSGPVSPDSVAAAPGCDGQDDAGASCGCRLILWDCCWLSLLWFRLLFGQVALGNAQRGKGKTQRDQKLQDANHAVDQHDVAAPLNCQAAQERAHRDGCPGQPSGDADDAAE